MDTARVAQRLSWWDGIVVFSLCDPTHCLTLRSFASSHCSQVPQSLVGQPQLHTASLPSCNHEGAAKSHSRAKLAGEPDAGSSDEM